MIDWFVNSLHNNQVMQAAVVAAPMTALVYTARNLPSRIYRFVKRNLTTEIRFNSDIGDYAAVQSFVMETVASKAFSRSFLYGSERKWDPASNDYGADQIGLTVGYGMHFGSYRRRPVLIERNPVDAPGTDKFKETITVTIMSRSRKLAMAFAEDIRQHSALAGQRDSIGLFVNGGGWWRMSGRLPLRDMETVFTPMDEATILLDHLRAFETSRDCYRARGTPWHTGVLLTGKPGTGKTSLIHAVASALGRSIHYLNLGSVESDAQLTELVSSGRGWHRAILVIEDADATGAQVNRAPTVLAEAPTAEPRKPLTLSAILNLLDGLLTPDGLMVIATSNHPEKLDPALIRPGRFDLHLDIGDLGWPAFVGMANLFGFSLDIDDQRRTSFLPKPGADLRAMLLDGDIAGAFELRAA